MLRSRIVAVGLVFALMSVLVFAGTGMAKIKGGSGPPPPPPGDSGWRAYTDMNHTTCAVEVSGRVWVGTGYAGLAVYDVTTAALLAKYHGVKDALSAPETIVHLVDLPSDCILDITTQNGIVWAATDQGLVRINPAGPTFKTYTRLTSGLSSDYIRRIMLGANPDEPSRIYFMTDYGVCSATYDYGVDDWNDDWEYFNSWRYPEFVSDNVFCIGFEQCADERVFFGTDCGVMVFDPSMPEADPMRWFCWDSSNSGLPSNLVIDVAFAECRELFFATDDGLAALEDGQWRVYTQASTAALGLLDDQIARMIVDPTDDTVFWLATGRGVNTYDRVGDAWTTYVSGETGLCNNEVRDIEFVSSVPYFATEYGACRKVGGVWRTYLDPLAFRGCVSALGFYAHEDLMFLGTYGGGLYILSDSNPASPDWTHYFAGDGSGLPSNFITAIDMVDDEDYVMFLGTDEGFAVGEGDYDDLDFTTYNMSNTSGGLISNAVTAVAAYEQDDELALIGTQHGLAVYDNRFPSQGLRWTFDTVESSDGGLADNWVNDIAVSRDGSTFWLATMWGASSYDPIADVWQTFRTTNSGLISDIVFCVDVDPEGNPWFGTMRGVCTCAPDGTNWHSYRKNNTGLASDIVLSIEVDYAGYVWAGTDAGLSCLNPGLGVCDYNYFADNSGLFSSRICSIDVDPYGNRWFGTQVGVSELLNQGPSLYGGVVTPDTGDRTTVFVYSVHYSDPECEGPVYIFARVDDTNYDMTLVDGDYCDGTWEYSTTLSAGNGHSYSFLAVEADWNIAVDGPYSGPTVSAAPYSPDPYEWDDSCMAATLLPTDGTWQDGHNLEPPGDEDWFAFDAEYNITYVIDVEDDADPDYAGNVYLYDLGDPCPGALLRQDLGGDEAHIVFPCLVTGRYYLKVEQANPAEMGAYKIRVYGPQWPMVQRDLERTGSAVGSGSATTNLLWIYTIPDDIITTAPVVDGQGNVYFGTSDNSLFAVATDGTLKWSYHTPDAVSATPALTYDEKIFFGTEGGQLYALNSDGTQAWVYDGALGSAIHAGVTVNRVENYTIYFGADDGTLYAVNGDGTAKWQYACPVPDEITGTIMVGELENIYFGGGCGTFYVLFPDGTLAWSYNSGLADNRMAAAMATDGSIYFGTSTRRFCCVDPPAPPDMPTSGTLRWEVIMPASVYSVPVIAPDGTVFFGCDDGIIYSIDQHSTATTIVYDVGAPIRSALVMDGAGHIYFGADSNRYYCITQAGDLGWETEDLNEPPAFSCAIDRNGTFYWAKPDGKLVTYNDMVVADIYAPASDCWSPTFANASTVPIVVGFSSWDVGVRKTGIAYTELWYSHDGGPWAASGLDAKLGTSGQFVFMPSAEGVFGFATVAYDNATPPNAEIVFLPKTTTVFDATVPTSLCAVEHYVVSKDDIDVGFTLEDYLSGPAKTRLWLRFNDGTWFYTGLEETGGSGSFVITLPEDANGSYYFLTQGVDNAENWEQAPSGASEPETWLIYDTVPPTSACTAPLDADTAPIAVSYTSGDAGSGVDNVSLYYTYNSDGSDLSAWRRYPATGAAPAGTIEFTPRAQSPWNEGPGQYLFASSAQDKCGNVEDFGRAISEGNVATTSYTPELPTSTASCDAYTSSLPITIDYVATDRSGMGIASVSLYYALEGQIELFTGRTDYGVDHGTFAYSGPSGNPLLDGAYRFRVKVQDMAGGVQNDGLGTCTILLDRNAGTSRASGPAYSTGGIIPIEYTAWDDFSGVDTVTVFYRQPPGGWMSPMVVGHGEFGVIDFDPSAGDGLYEFYSMMQDKAGNAEAVPDVPDFTTIRDTVPPLTLAVVPLLVRESPVEVQYQSEADLSGIARVDLLFVPPGGSGWIESGLSSTAPAGFFYFDLGYGEGLYKIVTRATDNAGNLELLSSWAEVKFDATAPLSSCSGPYATASAPLNIDFNASDAVSGVLDVQLWYRYAPMIGHVTGDWTALATPATVASGTFLFAAPLGAGIYDFYTLSHDVAGNCEPEPVALTPPKATVRYDTTPPVSYSQVCVITGADERECSTVRFVRGLPFIVSFSTIDDISRVDSTTVYYRFNGGVWTDIGWTAYKPIGEFVFDIDRGVGAYDFTTISTDAAGNQELLSEEAECTAHIDLHAPSSSCASDEYASGATIDVRYSAEDDSGFVDTELHFRENGGQWGDSGLVGHATLGTLSFAPEEDGTYDFFTRAVDLAGRPEIMKNEAECTTIYDTTDPFSFVSVPAYVSAATITDLECTGTDNLSGIADMRIYSRFESDDFAFTGLETNAAHETFTYHWPEGEGRYELFSIAKDKAGNVQATPPSVMPCYVDMTPPSSSCIEVRIYGAIMMVQYTVVDNLAGVGRDKDLQLWFSHDGGDWQQATKATTAFPISRWFMFTPPEQGGQYSFYTIAVDRAGNVEAAPAVADISYTFGELKPFPTSLDFGKVIVGRSSIRNLQLINVGESDVSVTAAVAVSPEGVVSEQFKVISRIPFTVPAEDYSIITVRFTPATLGTISAVLRVSWQEIGSFRGGATYVDMVGFGDELSEPTIAIEATSAGEKGDEEMVLLASLRNPGASREVEAFVAVEDTAGNLWFWPEWSTEVSGVPLFLSEGFEVSGYELLRIPLASVTPGSYTFYAALAVPGTRFEFIGSISTSHFQAD